MTKAYLVGRISDKTGIERQDVQVTVEAFMESVRDSLENGHNVYLRGFGSFVIKRRAKKTGRDILKNKTIEIEKNSGIPDYVYRESNDYLDLTKPRNRSNSDSVNRKQNNDANLRQATSKLSAKIAEKKRQ